MSHMDMVAQALRWYEDEAKALAKHMQGGAHTQAVLASLTVLALDAGRCAEAARAALASLEVAKQEPLTDAQSMVDFARGYAAGERAALANWTKDASNYGNALNDAAWVFIETCPEKSTRLFNHCKPALRAAILKYAESLAAAPSPGSGT